MEKCENCHKDYTADFEMERWYREEYCLECNQELNKVCMVCDNEIEEDEVVCSRYCWEEFTSDY